MIKQSDVALIILVTGLSLFISFILLNSLIDTNQVRTAEIERVQSISTSFPIPDEKIFNDEAINPTELIRIGITNPDNPFSERDDEKKN